MTPNSLLSILTLSAQFALSVWALPSLSGPHTITTARTKEFQLSVTWEQHAPAGVSKEMILVNGQSPGPVIEVDQDDWVVVHVENKSPFNTTVHFHGIEMHGTPWADGTPGIVQRPIQPGKSFTHRFRATQYGSYWYHSHFAAQISDGLYGAIIIHPRSSDPKPFHLISANPATLLALEEAERNVRPLVMAEFSHLTSEERSEFAHKSGIEVSCYDSIMFNGKGSAQCLPEDEMAALINEERRFYLDAVPGATLTDKGCLPPAVVFAIGGSGPPKDGEGENVPPGLFSGCKPTKGPVEVIEAGGLTDPLAGEWIALDLIGAAAFMTAGVSIDEHDMWVYAVDGSYIEPQKVQAIHMTNGDRLSVLVKTHKAGDFKIRCNAVTAPQMLNGHAILRVKGLDSPHSGESKPFLNIDGFPISSKVVMFDEDKARPFPPEPIAQKADVMHKLNMKVAGASYLWALNSTRLDPSTVALNTPMLFQGPDASIRDNVTITTLNNTWVDLIFYTATNPLPPHPIHKHGNKMFKIGSGVGQFKWESVAEAIKEIPDQFNLVDPPRRDGFMSIFATKQPTWVAVRYHVNNPGPWLLHCHIENHLEGGMMMVIQDGVDAWPKVPAEYLNWKG